jgi:4a-hydroxytetrahydrobiopterin dehydratase
VTPVAGLPAGSRATHVRALERDSTGRRRTVALLGEKEIEQALAGIPDWSRDGASIRRTIDFDSFEAAMAFVNRVAQLAESANHHPDIDIRYSKVLLVLSTHSSGGLTNRDFDLAARIDRLLT